MQNKFGAMQAQNTGTCKNTHISTHPGLGLGRHLGLVLEIALVVPFPLGLDPIGPGLLLGRLGLGLEALEELLVDQRRGGQEAAGAGARRHVGGRCAGRVDDANNWHSRRFGVGGDGEGIDNTWGRRGHRGGGGEDGGGLHLADCCFMTRDEEQ